jgi:hypothetical protein
MSNKLAVFGGEPAIPSGTFHPWPPITEYVAQLMAEELRWEQAREAAEVQARLTLE